MAKTRFINDAGLTARMTLVMFLLGGLFVALVVVLMWFYFTSAILLFSAATAKACSKSKVQLGIPFVSRKPSSATPMDVQRLPENAGENI